VIEIVVRDDRDIERRRFYPVVAFCLALLVCVAIAVGWIALAGAVVLVPYLLLEVVRIERIGPPPLVTPEDCGLVAGGAE
jgi:amino acid permease